METVEIVRFGDYASRTCALHEVLYQYFGDHENNFKFWLDRVIEVMETKGMAENVDGNILANLQNGILVYFKFIFTLPGGVYFTPTGNFLELKEVKEVNTTYRMKSFSPQKYMLKEINSEITKLTMILQIDLCEGPDCEVSNKEASNAFFITNFKKMDQSNLLHKALIMSSE